MERKFTFTKDTDIFDSKTLNSMRDATTIIFESNPPTEIFSETVPVLSSLTKVEFTDGVTVIPPFAFYNYRFLQEIKFPEINTEEIKTKIICGYYAFQGCGITKLRLPGNFVFGGDEKFVVGEGLFSICDKLTIVEIMDGVTDIPNDTFFRCKSLQSVVIPNSVKCISGWAFRGCTSLASITIPYSVTHIDIRAFGDCSSLASVTIPRSVTSIAPDAFEGCPDNMIIYTDSTIDFATLFGGIHIQQINTNELQKMLGEVLLQDVANIVIRTLTGIHSTKL